MDLAGSGYPSCVELQIMKSGRRGVWWAMQAPEKIRKFLRRNVPMFDFAGGKAGRQFDMRTAVGTSDATGC